MAAYVEMDQVTKTYQMGEVTIKAADGISFQVEKGEFVVVVGPSGAGKTTVLNILGGMDTATTGKVSVDGTREKVDPVSERGYWFRVSVL